MRNCGFVASCVVAANKKVGLATPLPTGALDQWGLPIFSPQSREPKHITKRREFLKQLSVHQRNLLLTGDPLFSFDPIAYDSLFFILDVHNLKS